MYSNKTPAEMRDMIRQNKLHRNTSGICGGFVQANVVILPEEYAVDFRAFAKKNPTACPVLEELPAGEFLTRKTADEADMRTDVPKYKVFIDGKFIEYKESIAELWQKDFVTFLLGCSFSFENAFLKQGVPVRQIEQNRNVPMYITSIPCKTAGRFKGTMVVSMRPIPEKLVDKAIGITMRYPLAHGEPVHVGDPSLIGIKDIQKPDFGDSVEFKEGDIPVFWPCGVTPQNAAINAKPNIMITHAPGYMFICDLKDEDILV
ncbi:MAG: putative hydro-lyase [Peptostreptococcaceae bacterium]|nr:putative hydro-lyase [Peptostreptococcaceae bacterium]